MTDTSGTQGQASGNQQGGTTGQEPGAEAGQGQASDQQQGQNQGQQQDQGQQGQGQGAQQFDLSTIQDPALRGFLEQQQRQLSEVRQEAARYRTERNTLQGQVQEFQRQNETAEQAAQREAQERQARLEELEQENRTLKVNTRVETAAKEAKAHNPATVVRMLAPQVELDDKGEPKNLQALLDSLRESDPYLFKRTRTNGGEGNGDEDGPDGDGDMNSLIRRQVAARRGTSRT